MYRFRLCFIPLIVASALFASGCRTVEENSPDISSVTVIMPASETTTADTANSETAASEAAETSASGSSGAMTAAELPEETIAETQTKTETAAETAASVSETSEIKSANAETTGKKSETKPQTTQASQETKLTLQQESPPETTAKDTETEFKTEKQTISALQTSPGTNSYSALNFDEQKGFWITYLEYASILRGKSERSFKNSVSEYFDNISTLGFNTVYVQVRAFGDAYYDSELYPSGEQFDGTIGTANSFDALQVMIDCAHERGLSIHAWVNPMRLMTTSQLEKIDSCYPIKKWYDSGSCNGKYIVKSDGRWYLNPAYDEVTDLISAGITEIVSQYKVDGIQIDDYFYPTSDKSFDMEAYSENGNGMSLSEWRISNVNKMVKKLCKAVHSANSTAVFGISPQGSVDNNYSQLYADVRTWCSESGYCDYILPQVYFGFDSAALPFADVAAQWNSMVKNDGVQLVIGLAAYKIGAEDSWAGGGKREWINNSDIISRQMALAKTMKNYGGVAIYRYDSLFNPESAVSAQVSKELENIEK